MKAATRNRITAIGMVVLFAVVALVVIERSCIRTVPIGVVSPAWPAPGSEDSLSFIALDRKPAVFPFVDVVSWREEEAEPEGETEETFSFRLVVRTKNRKNSNASRHALACISVSTMEKTASAPPTFAKSFRMEFSGFRRTKTTAVLWFVRWTTLRKRTNPPPPPAKRILHPQTPPRLEFAFAICGHL